MEGFTPVGYFFAKQLYDSLRIPVGLINSSSGGTNVEPGLAGIDLKVMMNLRR